MKIAFIIPSMLKGGAERVISVLCNKFSDRNHIVYLLLSENSKEIEYPLDSNINIRDISSSKHSFIAKMPEYIKKIKRVLIKEHIEVVVSFITRTNVCAIIACRQLKIPVIVSERNNPYLVPADRISKLIRKIIYEFSDGYVFQTTYARNYFSKRIIEKSRIIMNPMSEIDFQKVDFNEKRDVIISACRLAPQKNLPLLIEAFSKIEKEIPNVNIEIYGDGPEKNRIQNMIQHKGLTDRIYLMGQTDDIISIIAKSKYFVLTSNFEGLSNALMEALCVGAACLATDSPTYGNRELIKNNENGYLVPVKDVDIFSKKLLEIVKNDEVARRFSQKAYALYNKVNSDVIADKWEDYIEYIIERK